MKPAFLLVPAATAAVLVAFALSPAPAASAPKGYKVVAVKDGGTIRGVCRLKEGIAAGRVDHFKDNDKGCGDKDQASQRIVVGAERGLANCVVWIKVMPQGKDWSPAMAKGEDERTGTIDQKGCEYHPHVQWLRVGTQVVVLNSDNAEHNIHGYRATLADTQFNFASLPGKTMDRVDSAFLDKTALYLVKCDIHPWMNAYVFVVDHPYVDVTAAEAAGDKKCGEFLLTDVPAGEWTLVFWHEGFKEDPVVRDSKISTYQYSDDVKNEVKVTVTAGGTTVKDWEVSDPQLSPPPK